MNEGRTIGQLAVLIQSGALDPVSLAEETLDAIRSHRDRSIFTCITVERALTEAEDARRRIRSGRSLGMLDGIPLAWKDLFDLEGLVATAGSKVLAREEAASVDAHVVANLRAAGMVTVGRTNMSEFAFSGLGLNPHFGTPANPHATDVSRVPGGSSSGSGVAVAAGLIPLAIGTDTGGSIRIPAAFNGIVGYKATRGRYAMQGVFPLSRSLDSLGPLCRTVSDAIWVDAAMRGQSVPTARRICPGKLKLVIPQTIFFDDIERGVAEAFEASVQRLASLGASIRRARFPLFSDLFELMATYGPLVSAEAYALHRERLTGVDASDMDPRVVARAKLGARTSMADYIHITNERARMTGDLAAQLATDEWLLSPTLPHVAPLLQDDDAFARMNAKTLRNTLIGNFFDWCGVSLPCGYGDAGMPVGLMLSGLAHSDDQLLGAALAIEDVVAP